MTPDEQWRQMPTAETIDGLARQTVARLPAPFQETLREVVLLVEEIADPETSRRVGVANRRMLSGLYEGVPINRQGVNPSGLLPERITLYRLPIVDEWRSSEFSLQQIVSHIVIHEVGHHFGSSDADMSALERE